MRCKKSSGNRATAKRWMRRKRRFALVGTTFPTTELSTAKIAPCNTRSIADRKIRDRNIKTGKMEGGKIPAAFKGRILLLDEFPGPRHAHGPLRIPRIHL